MAAGTVQASAVAAETGDADDVRSEIRGCSQASGGAQRCIHVGHGAANDM